MPLVLSNVTLATMAAGARPYGLIEQASIVIEGDKIAWVGPSADMPAAYSDGPHEDLAGRLVTPALIDCHTHLVFGGNRAREFELRLQGASYEEIARAGGGIRSTVQHTRAASKEQLTSDALTRLDSLIEEGAGTVEIKSGYGLDLDTEIKTLQVARELAEKRNVRIKTSFLGAHAVPPEYEGRPDDYIGLVCEEMLPEVQRRGLADAVDGFCEGIAFSPDQIARVFAKAKQCSLPIKLHAEQLSDLGGAAMAARAGAMSVDHLEYLNLKDVDVVAQCGTVAVLLPGAFYTLRETQLPPVEALRAANVAIAVATDCNPGSSPLASLLLAMNMACTLFRLTPEEALAGVTRTAAQALRIDHETGTLAAGKSADLAIWDVKEPAELAYRIAFNPLYRRYCRGRI